MFPPPCFAAAPFNLRLDKISRPAPSSPRPSLPLAPWAQPIRSKEHFDYGKVTARSLVRNIVNRQPHILLLEDLADYTPLRWDDLIVPPLVGRRWKLQDSGTRPKTARHLNLLSPNYMSHTHYMNILRLHIVGVAHTSTYTNSAD